MNTYTIGLDFGTLSCRGIIAAVADGEQIASAQFVYPHGVMDTALPCGVPLPPGWALQHPKDYLDALSHILPALMGANAVPRESIVGIGVDFTACTMLPVTKDGTPLCFFKEYEREPHAYVKLWKHHAAQSQADRLTALAEKRKEPFLLRCGGKVSAQNAFPKLLQLWEEAPAVYQAMDLWVEAADWIVWQLTGSFSRSANCLGYKAFYDLREGFPPAEYFTAASPGLHLVLDTKMAGPISPVGGKAGTVSREAERRFALPAGMAAATPMIDGHVCFPVSGIGQPGAMLGILGTSGPYFCLCEYQEPIPNLCAMVDDGLVPGYSACEAGLNCVGDQFAWAAANCCPPAYVREAKEKGVPLQSLLTEKARALKPGESGLVALDWLNGNRSLLMDTDVRGLLLGMTLATRPEEIYRALLEATAFATRMITDHFAAHGVPIRELRLTGGVSHKNTLLMQIFADVLQMPVKILATDQGSALGSAIYAAVAAGEEAGGCKSLDQAMAQMGSPTRHTYLPILKNVPPYQRLYAEYRLLYHRFGLEDGAMKRLGAIQREAARRHGPKSGM